MPDLKAQLLPILEQIEKQALDMVSDRVASKETLRLSREAIGILMGLPRDAVAVSESDVGVLSVDDDGGISISDS